MGKVKKTRKSAKITKKVLEKEESRISLSVEEEYERLGIIIGFGVPKDDVPFEDDRIDCARRNYEGMKRLRAQSEERLGSLKEKTQFHTDAHEHLMSQEEEFRRYAFEVEVILKEFDYRCAKIAMNAWLPQASYPSFNQPKSNVTINAWLPQAS